MARAAGPLIHLGTRCGSVDEFVERFAPFATETSLVMPTASEVAPGTEGRFVIHLKDRTPIMSGRCRVEEVKPVGGRDAGAHGDARAPPRHGRAEPQHSQAAPRGQAPDAARPRRRRRSRRRLRIVRPPTLIGATPPPPIGTAPTLIGTVAPSLPPALPPPAASEEAEKTMESIKVPEMQAPSAAFTPAGEPALRARGGRPRVVHRADAVRSRRSSPTRSLIPPRPTTRRRRTCS